MDEVANLVLIKNKKIFLENTVNFREVEMDTNLAKKEENEGVTLKKA